MISGAIPLIISPFIGYLTPEIYETVEVRSRDRKKKFSRLIVTQFIILLTILIIVNLFLEQILALWLGKNINSFEISKYLIPLSINAFSISLFNSLKIFFIAENEVTFMKKPLVLTFFLFVFLTIIIYF